MTRRIMEILCTFRSLYEIKDAQRTAAQVSDTTGMTKEIIVGKQKVKIKT